MARTQILVHRWEPRTRPFGAVSKTELTGSLVPSEAHVTQFLDFQAIQSCNVGTMLQQCCNSLLS